MMRIELGINVDIDRFKFLSRDDPHFDVEVAEKTHLIQVSIGKIVYFSWIAKVNQLKCESSYREKIKASVSKYFEDQAEIFLTGNGIDTNREMLEDVIGKDRLSQINKHSQLMGITQGLMVLINANTDSSLIYCLKPQSMLDIKNVKYRPELVLPADVKFPLLMVSIKGGTTFYRINSFDSAPKKVIASIFGEFTLAGIIKLITRKYPYSSINEILKNSIRNGINLKVDLSVGDIYGDGVDQVAGLHRDIIASSLGKNHSQLENPSDEDYIISSLVMLAINVANIGALVVSQIKARQ